MRIKEVHDIDTETELGKLLLMAIAKITTTAETGKTPDEVLHQLNKTRDDVFEIVTNANDK